MIEPGDAERAADMLGRSASELAGRGREPSPAHERPAAARARGARPGAGGARAVRASSRTARRRQGHRAGRDRRGRCPDDVETLAYRVVQEALSNVGKHADATNVTVRVEGTGAPSRVEIRTTGRGSIRARPGSSCARGGSGWRPCASEPSWARGTFTIRSRPGRGNHRDRHAALRDPRGHPARSDRRGPHVRPTLRGARLRSDQPDASALGRGRGLGTVTGSG